MAALLFDLKFGSRRDETGPPRRVEPCKHWGDDRNGDGHTNNGPVDAEQ